MATDVAIDIGTARTRVATTQGLIFDEATMVAIDTATGAVVDVGDGAIALVGASPRHVAVFRPLAQGTTVDFDVTARLIVGLLQRAGVSKLSRARVVMSVPTVATSIERRALRQAAIQAGAKDVAIMEAPVAAAIGVGLPVQDPVGSAIAVLGAGVSEAALISIGGIVTSAATRTGGSDIDAAIATALRLRHGLVVPPRTLEQLKIEMGSALGHPPTSAVPVRARTVDTGQVMDVHVRADLITSVVKDVMAQILRTIEECLADAPPDLAQDISTQGLYLVGGHAQLTDVAAFVGDATGVPVHNVTEPDRMVIRGLQMCLEEMSSLHVLFRTTESYSSLRPN